LARGRVFRIPARLALRASRQTRPSASGGPTGGNPRRAESGGLALPRDKSPSGGRAPPASLPKREAARRRAEATRNEERAPGAAPPSLLIILIIVIVILLQRGRSASAAVADPEED